MRDKEINLKLSNDNFEEIVRERLTTAELPEMSEIKCNDKLNVDKTRDVDKDFSFLLRVAEYENGMLWQINGEPGLLCVVD